MSGQRLHLSRLELHTRGSFFCDRSAAAIGAKGAGRKVSAAGKGALGNREAFRKLPKAPARKRTRARPAATQPLARNLHAGESCQSCDHRPPPPPPV